MELEIVQTVLTDMLEEQKATNQLNQEVVAKLKELEEKVTGFDQKLETVHLTAPPVNLTPVQKEIMGGIKVVTQIVEAQPKNVIRQFRLLFFPETNAGYYYKIVFGRLIPWGFAFAGLVFLIALGNKYIETSMVIAERKYDYEVYRTAWQRLENMQEKAGRQKMEEILQKAVNDHK